MAYISGVQKDILERGCEGVAVRGRYRWVFDGMPVGAEVSRLCKQGLAVISEWGNGRAALNATEMGRSVLSLHKTYGL